MDSRMEGRPGFFGGETRNSWDSLAAARYRYEGSPVTCLRLYSSKQRRPAYSLLALTVMGQDSTLVIHKTMPGTAASGGLAHAVLGGGEWPTSSRDINSTQ